MSGFNKGPGPKTADAEDVPADTGFKPAVSNTAMQDALTKAVSAAQPASITPTVTVTATPATPTEKVMSNVNTGTTETKKPGTIQSMLTRLAVSTLASGAVTGTLADFKETMAKVLDTEVPKALGIKLYLSSDENNLAAPLIVLYAKYGHTVYYYAAIAEALINTSRLNNVEQTINHGKISIDMPPSKVFDEIYRAAIRAKLAELTQCTDVVAVYFQVIPKTAKISSEEVCTTFFNTAAMAIVDRYQPRPAIDAATLKADDIQLAVRTEVNPGGTAVLSGGEHVASDAVVSIVASQKKLTAGSPNDGNAPLVLSKANVQLCLLKQDPRMNGGGYHMMNQMNQMGMAAPTPAYHPMLVLTGVEGEGGLESAATVAMAVMSICQLATGRNFVSLMSTNFGSGPKRMGLLGYDHQPFPQPPQPAELVVENSFQPSTAGAFTVQQFAECFFHNSMTVCIDVRDGGRSSWTQQLWLKIAAGDADAQLAMLRIFDSITDNKFSPLWEKMGGGVLVSPVTTTIHNGTFPDQQGARHDIREIDYFYCTGVMKETSSSVDGGVANYACSFAPGATNGPEGLIRLHQRRQDILQIEPMAEIDGISTRLFMHPNLMKACAMALAEAKVRFAPEGLFDKVANNQLMSGFVPGVSVDYASSAQVFQAGYTAGPNQLVYSHVPNVTYL